MQTVEKTNFNFPGQKNIYRGKVREVYNINDELLVMIASDRISAFDVILPRSIPYKGQVLNQTASYFLKATRDIVPNWLIDTPDPNVAVGYKCKPIRLEMVIRGYLTGHAWRVYKSGKRSLCGVPLPDGMKENDKFPHPIITPATKAEEGHDEDISREDILKQEIVDEKTLGKLEEYTKKLFLRGTEMAAKNGLILVDTKYEFGFREGKIMLMDEIHTPDSSRYFFLEGYEERQKKNLPQQQLSKEFVREWLMENGFQGKPGQEVPVMSDEMVKTTSDRYIQLYEKVTGNRFYRENLTEINDRMDRNVRTFLAGYYGRSERMRF